jgi:hypothetical protein
MVVGCRGRMIAATWLVLTIAQLMLRIFDERTAACKSWASHRMKWLVLSDGTRSVANLVNFYFCCKTTSDINLEIASKFGYCRKLLVVSILKLLY